MEAFSTYAMDGFGLLEALFYQSTPENVSIFLEKLMHCYIVDTEGVAGRKISRADKRIVKFDSSSSEQNVLFDRFDSSSDSSYRKRSVRRDH